MSDFPLLMLSAMYENGGNVTHRLLDGHRQLFVYPFESQLGTHTQRDALSGLFPSKYRWPSFPLTGTPGEDYLAIVDEECKVRTRTPRVSKFRDCRFTLDDDQRRTIYEHRVATSGRSRAANVEAFFRATFEAWTDRRASSDQQRVFVGYSPVVVIDSHAILADFPSAHILHVVRNPWSAYADTKKRPLPLSLVDYMLRWSFVQSQAELFARLHPDRVHIARFEDILTNPTSILGSVLESLDIDGDPSLATMSFDGDPLEEGRPWGTISEATPAANRATAAELVPDERKEVTLQAGPWLDRYGYRFDSL